MEKEPVFKDKLILLHRRRIDVPNSNVTVLGCSLWSRIVDEAKPMVRARVKDYSNIKDWSPDRHNEEHETDMQWLRDQVANIQRDSKLEAKKPSFSSDTTALKRSVLVVSHHAPCLLGTSEPRFDDSPWASAFATDILNKADD